MRAKPGCDVAGFGVRTVLCERRPELLNPNLMTLFWRSIVSETPVLVLREMTLIALSHRTCPALSVLDKARIRRT